MTTAPKTTFLTWRDVQRAEPSRSAYAWTVHTPKLASSSGQQAAAAMMRAAFEVREFFDVARIHLLRQVEDLAMRVNELERRHSSCVPTFLNTLRDPNLELLRPVGVMLEFDGDRVVATWHEALLDSEGDGADDALAGLAEQIVDAYRDLHEAQAKGLKLAGHPAELWGLLSGFVRSR
jgi:hypothetical protein